MNQKTRILIVEDDSDFAGMISDFLLDYDADWEVNVAYSGPAALEELQRRDYQAVLCDVRMPGMSGMDLLRQSRNQNFKMPFVFLTAFAEPEAMNEALALGAFDFLDKILTPESICRVVRKAVESVQNTSLAPSKI